MGFTALFCAPTLAQNATIFGRVSGNGVPLPHVNILLKGTKTGAATDENGMFSFSNIAPGRYVLLASSLGHEPFRTLIVIEKETSKEIDIELNAQAQALDETVVTGTLKPVGRLESTVPVEVYSPAFLRKNPTATLFDALQNVNGIRPQINCNVCNTGGIRINGLEGPYTLVMIDGMPIVSGLGTVYGLSGIPSSLIEQIEIVKGPASTLYGSEAVGGLINVITKNTFTVPRFSADGFATGWGEYNLDVGAKFKLGKTGSALLGINYFNFGEAIDNNGDNFTDMALQERISIFQKMDFARASGKSFSIAGRFFREDRWGGELGWGPEFRGGTEIYGESIFTKRWEVTGKYQLPMEENVSLSVSYNDHHQDSAYGNEIYIANQCIGFAQLIWDKNWGRHDFLLGSTLRYTYYDDSTPATESGADEVTVPGLFVQDELQLGKKHSLLAGLRYDRDGRHGNIFTPRLAHRWKLGDNSILRFNSGAGFRVVNLFTEDHAALTGSRDVIIAEELAPERSWNLTLGHLQKWYLDNGTFVSFDASAFLTRFSNAILPDFDTDPNQIIYDNLDGRSVSQGISANIGTVFPNGPRIRAGATVQEVKSTENGVTKRQVLTEGFTGTWSFSYTIGASRFSVDYTGNVYGPMRLPLLGPLDPRREFSPVHSIQNVQFTYGMNDGFELYGGIKNLLDHTPDRDNPFIIARADDPFDTTVTFQDSSGNRFVGAGNVPDSASGVSVVATDDNPFGLSFDPDGYSYAPNQGIRGFLGVRYKIN